MKIRTDNRVAARAPKVPATRKKPGAVSKLAQSAERNKGSDRIGREADRQEPAPEDVEQPFGGVSEAPVPRAGGRPR